MKPHVRHAPRRHVSGGRLVPHVRLYDEIGHRFLLASLLDGIASDVASVSPEGGRVLEVGCGPGRLSISLARRYGIDVTAVDLDPEMVDRARANAARAGGRPESSPSFLVGDAAALPFPEEAFDVVVSTLSMHHWDDPVAGLTEIGRVLRPDGRALIWDFRTGRLPLHGRLPDPADHARASPLRPVSVRPWRWPWRFTPLRRVELARA